jgi:hypothetical protein
LFSGWPSEELAINVLRFQAERAFLLEAQSDEESNWDLGRLRPNLPALAEPGAYLARLDLQDCWAEKIVVASPDFD